MALVTTKFNTRIGHKIKVEGNNSKSFNIFYNIRVFRLQRLDKKPATAATPSLNQTSYTKYLNTYIHTYEGTEP